MALRHVFLGVALAAGSLTAPGLYYMAQENDIVRAQVNGVVRADDDKKFPGRKYFIHTQEHGKLDTFAIPNGFNLREGCLYDFNLKSARFQMWPPSYSRSIIGYKHVPTPLCPK